MSRGIATPRITSHGSTCEPAPALRQTMSSFGEEFKRERELREFTLREVSESTKISLRHLEALERNDFEQLPGGVFNRGFVRA